MMNNSTIMPTTAKHEPAKHNKSFVNELKNHSLKNSAELPKRNVYSHLSNHKQSVPIKVKASVKMRSKYSVDLTSRLPTLINKQVKEGCVKHTMINLNRANIYGIKIDDMPCLQKTFLQSKNLTSKNRKQRNIKKLLTVLRKMNRN